ncbi:MAG: hypothetical protein IT329_08925 [Caldilineaceae bacterium]|nr:hypothetical protein [Caldilineaceae bacterium]
MAKETATYQQLQRIIAQPGCPLCGLVQQAASTYLDTLLWESSTDFNLQAMLTASLGFCGRHSRQLLTFGGQRLAAAVVERTTLLAAIRRLPELTDTAEPPPVRFRLGRRKFGTQTQPDAAILPDSIQPCPACLREAAETARGTETLLKHLDEFSGPLRAAGGLCLPHFIQTTRAAPAPQRAVLLAIQQAVWQDLAGHLEEFIRKHMDHHHTDPISDPARLSVERTIAALTGEVPVR